jgi:ribosomal protein S18 acetylase RimI-like enzyme
MRPALFMETFTIATAPDLPQLVALLHALFTQEAEFVPDAARQERGLRLIIENPDAGVILVAKAGDQVCGMVILLFTISTAQGGRVAWLEDMVIRPDARGTSLGSRLLSHAITEARARGLTRISLLTDTVNARAQAFYKKHGFAESPMLPMRLYL